MGKWLLVCFFVTMFPKTTLADHYYNKIGACPKGTRPRQSVLAQVDERLLPKYQPNQGDSSTCSIHAGMILANSIYKLNQIKNNSDHQTGDLSILDGMFRFGTSDEELKRECSLPFIDSISSFLIKLRKKSRVLLDPIAITLQTAIAGNDTLLSQVSRCQDTSCGEKITKKHEVHPPCLKKICDRGKLKEITAEIQDWNRVAKDLNPNFPIQTLIQNSNPVEVEIPPFQIKTWDQFKSEDELFQKLLSAFTQQETTLPIGLNTLVNHEDDAGHAIALKRVDQIDCMGPSGEVQKTLYQAHIINSWGRGKNGPFNLEELAHGMFALKSRTGFTQILPCDPATQSCDSVLIEHALSLPVLHYVEANDIQGVKKQLAKRTVNPNAANASGMTPLLVASLEGHDEIVRLLVERPDTDPNLSMDQGATPLFFAAQEGHLECVQALMRRDDLNPNIAWKGKTPLYVAAIQEHREVVRELLRSPLVTRKPHRDYYQEMKKESPDTQESYLAAARLIQEITYEVDVLENPVPRAKKRKRGG